MPSNCPECGSSNVVEDDLYSQRQWVCVDCGSVVSEGHLTTTLSEETQGIAVPYHASTEESKKPCRNLIAGYSRVRALCRILRLSTDMESAVVSLFGRAYNHPNFIYVTLTKKEILGGCCVLSVCRQCNWPVAMGTVGYLLGVENATLGAVYREFTKALNIEISTVGIMDMLESFCYDFKLGPQQVEEVFAEPPQRLVDRTSALIELAADAWIFCKIGQAPEQSWRRSRDSVVKRLKELRDVLCKLGRALPWLRGGTVEPNTVVQLVDDILKNRRALLMRAVRNYEHQLQNEAQPAQMTECDNKPSESNCSDSPSSKTPELIDPIQVECESPSDKEATDCQLPPNHWSKSHLFLPPCVKSRKRQRVDAPQPEVTGDEDISDSEIESYIRSQDEIEMYLKVQKKLKET
ncbi:Transcription factor IIIB 50 kDa subunit [Labeo rohita]|uniref:Transcription factor IIIB 50 kDa subunit n=1 Tax=Labeo rohita TaxID=84645 RepID=A0ABQ8MA45_LABRO|nr:Transcription factor IIIB 50 kDa subunit [Labeo rohita]